MLFQNLSVFACVFIYLLIKNSAETRSIPRLIQVHVISLPLPIYKTHSRDNHRDSEAIMVLSNNTYQLITVEVLLELYAEKQDLSQCG